METFFYWVEVFDSLKCIACVFSVIIAVCFIVLSIMRITSVDCDSFDNGDRKTIKKLFYTSLISLLILAPMSIFIPSKHTMYLMKGFGMVENVMKDANAKKIPQKTFDLLNEYLDQELENIKSKKDKK